MSNNACNQLKMKLNMRHIGLIIFTLLLIICSRYKACSQEFESTTRHIPGLFYGFSLSPSQTKILNSGSVYDTSLVTTKQNSMFGTAEIGYFFSDYFGLSTGIGYTSYKTKLQLKSFQKNFPSIDSDKEAFEMIVSGSGIQELQTVNFLTIPFCIHLRLPVTQTFGLFVKAGINLALPVTKKYASSGTFTYKGYYPTYNVLFENLPKYGFVNDSVIKSNGVLDVTMSRFNTLASVGFDVYVTNTLQFSLAANFSNSLLKESNSSNGINVSPDKFQLTPNANHINSFMEGSSKATAQSMGLEITFRFFIK